MTDRQAPGRVRPEDPGPLLDEAAVLESHAIAKGEYRRRESVRAHVHWASLVVFWAFVVGTLIIGAAWLYHLVTPAGLHFLDGAQRDTLQTILVSVVGSSAVTAHARRWFATRE